MIKIYTDGSFRKKHNAAASAIVIIFDDKSIQVDHKYIGNKTNNYAELNAIKMALCWCIKHRLCNEQIIISSDSTYAIGITKQEMNPKANKELAEEVIELSKEFKNLSIRWVKSHSANRYNRLADTLANICVDMHNGLDKTYP
tara:strand:- start:126 stop:554 length:429 start_codon:yes stop_codon:yes gene_type:complete